MSASARRYFVALAILGLASAPRPVAAEWSHNPWFNNPVCTATGDQAGPKAIPDGSGGVIIAWSDQRSGNWDIYAQRLDADGVPQWTANGVAVCTAVFDQGAQVLVSDGAGGAILAWQDGRNGNLDIFVQRLNSSGVPQWTANGVALCTAGNTQTAPDLVTDGAGGAIVAWRDYRFDATGDVFARRVDAAGTPLWTADGVALCTAGLDQHAPQVVTDAAGGAIVVWMDFRSGSLLDIYAQRVNGAGVPQWTANGNGVSTLPGSNQAWPKAVADGAGGVVVAWQDFRGVNADIFAQRMSPSGAVLWPGDRFIGWSAGDDYADGPNLVPDGTGGAFIGFHYHVGQYEIGLTRIGGAGVVLAGPMTVSTNPTDQVNPTMTSDGSGGVILSYLAGYTDYGSMRLSSSLVQQWGTYGAAWTVALGDQVNQVIVPDGAGGGILVWQDPRNAAATGYDIYAQRIDHHGKYPEVAPTIARVRDVPNDQGGKLKLSWDASYLDADPYYEVDEYRIWRSVPVEAAALALRDGSARLLGRDQTPVAIEGRVLDTSIEGGQTIYWELLGTQVAAGDAGYSYVVPTTSDSLGSSNPYTLVRVQAMHATSSAFWTSKTDSGYSVDNLAPAMPAPFVGAYLGGNTHLHWGANLEVDLSHYRIHRGSSAGFVPGPGNLIASPPDTGYADAGIGGYFYKLAAVDIHGNVSPFALLTPMGTLDTPLGGVTELSLARPSPNPARGEAVIGFALPRAGAAALEVFDPSGRRVRVLRNGVAEAGEHTVRFDLRDEGGRPLGSGLYFVRLMSERRVLSSPFVVVR